jgi:hypothetical protein
VIKYSQNPSLRTWRRSPKYECGGDKDQYFSVLVTFLSRFSTSLSVKVKKEREFVCSVPQSLFREIWVAALLKRKHPLFSRAVGRCVGTTL